MWERAPSPVQSSRARPKLHYTLSELMVCAAAREIKDGELVFVGMRLPLIAFVVAKKTHAPNAIGLFENGVIRSTPARRVDLHHGRSAEYSWRDPMSRHARGDGPCCNPARVDLGFLGAAEVDRFGNLNSTQVQGPHGMIRLPGSGGACDIASLAHRFVVLLEHKKERLPERVSFMTSPGYGDGGEAGERKLVCRAAVPQP